MRKIGHLELKQENGRTALTQAINDKDVEGVQLLLSLGAEIDATD